MFKFTKIAIAAALATGIATAAQAAPCFTNSYAVADIGPCSGWVGSVLTVRQLRQTRYPLGRLVFRTVVANGVPAQIIVPLYNNGGGIYGARVPPHLCMAGGPRWEVILLTADLQNQGVIGSFQPICR